VHRLLLTFRNRKNSSSVKAELIFSDSITGGQTNSKKDSSKKENNGNKLIIDEMMVAALRNDILMRKPG